MSSHTKSKNSALLQRKAQLLALAVSGVSTQAAGVDIPLDLDPVQVTGGTQWATPATPDPFTLEGGLPIVTAPTLVNTNFLNNERLAIYDNSAVPGAPATEESLSVSLTFLPLTGTDGEGGAINLPLEDAIGDDINIAVNFNNATGNDIGAHNLSIDTNGHIDGETITANLAAENLTNSYLNSDGITLSITTNNNLSFSITNYSISIGAGQILIVDPTANDDDQDGILNAAEDNNTDNDNDPASNPTDTDGDGIADYLDLDSDNDGDSDNTENGLDTDNDGIPDYIDPNDAAMLAGGGDSDNDGVDDVTEGNVDTDGDGVADYLDTDSDNDGILDMNEATGDEDGDGIPDRIDNVSNPAPTPAASPSSSSSTLSSGPLLLISGLFVSVFRRFKSRK